MADCKDGTESSADKPSEASDIDLVGKEAETKSTECSNAAENKGTQNVVIPNEESWEEDTEQSSASGGPMDKISKLLSELGISKVQMDTSKESDTEPKPEQLLNEVTFDGVAQYIRSGKCKKIIVMTGAGISTAAGIPDFRSPGTGLYDNLQKYDLPSPQSVFEIGFFKYNPEPFYMLAKELYPGKFKPTKTHYFIKLLADKGLLLRNYTQNIDCLERKAGIDGDFLVEAHGSFHTAHCLECGKEYGHDWVRDEVFADRIPKCKECEDGIVKPDIVFFGESLPSRFGRLVTQDMYQCDLLIIMGTSLVVQPFASLVDRVPAVTPRLLINKEKCGQPQDFMSLLLGMKSGLMFDSKDNYRDVAWLGTCDDGCVALAELLGWKDELLELVDSNNKKLEEEDQTGAAGGSRPAESTEQEKSVEPKGRL